MTAFTAADLIVARTEARKYREVANAHLTAARRHAGGES